MGTASVRERRSDAETIHPYGVGGSDDIEDRLGDAAHAAGLALLTLNQQTWVAVMGLSLVPLLRHIGRVAMVGVVRPRYRPHTSRTAAWRAELETTGRDCIERYDRLAETVGTGAQGTRPRPADLRADFARWYAAYPKKVKRAAAEREWMKLNPDAARVAVLIAAVETQKTWTSWKEKQYIPNPSNWLAGKRWLDQRISAVNW